MRASRFAIVVAACALVAGIAMPAHAGDWSQQGNDGGASYFQPEDPTIGVDSIASLTLAACGGGQPQGAHGAGGHQMPPPPEVGVASPIGRELAPVKELTGTIEAVETVHISPQVSGPVVKVHVADGVEVKAGDPILDRILGGEQQNRQLGVVLA